MNLKIISAGAGSGKTYRLTSEMVDLLKPNHPLKVRPSGIIATTFTNKAAAELQERVRVRLLEEGLTKEADDLANALIGTVHGLGVKLLKRFAFEAGVSPQVDIIADEDQQNFFNNSLAAVLTTKLIDEMEALSERLGLNKKERYDWRREVKSLTDIARANAFDTEVLQKSCQLSITSFKSYLPPVLEIPAEDLNEQLRAVLKTTIIKLRGNEDATKKTQTAINTLQSFLNKLEYKRALDWHEWAKISKLDTGKKSKDDVEDLKDFAKKHDRHPDFHGDIERFITKVFEISIAAIEEYEQYKRRRGLIDYVDMETHVKKLLDNPFVKEVLAEELDLLMVDEFQDTSPLQLEIFVKLSQFAKLSIWVGDPKQSIYGFRGADPKLMKAIIDQTGGVKPEDIQEFSWRSREDVVHAVNALFVKAFPDIPPAQVALKPKREKINDPIEQDNAIIQWHFEYDGKGKRLPGKPWMENCIARSIKETLEQDKIIVPKGGTIPRPMQPSDIAVLCRSNAACQAVAEALHREGLKAAIARNGLLKTAETRLILACLKYILNANDTLSIAEILFLAAEKNMEAIIDNRLEHLNSDVADHLWGKEDDYIKRLSELRKEVDELSGAEILNLVLEALDLRRIIATWGNMEQRFSNIDALRQLAIKYEENCNRLHSAASLGGFLLWLGELEINGLDNQGSGESADAVNVLTYHKSKGLEWGMVVCHSLEGNLRDSIWGIGIVSETETVDLDNILGNRWLRYWINPYSDQFGKTRLEEKLNASPVKKEARIHALAEEARLLYVGATRARDYLVIPTRKKPTKWLNRCWHNGMEDVPTLDHRDENTPWVWNNVEIPKDCEVRYFPKQFTHTEAEEKPIHYLSPTSHFGHHRPFMIDVDKEEFRDLYNAKIIGKTDFYITMPTLHEDLPKYLFAKVVKAFLTADNKNYTTQQRSTIAQQLLDNHLVPEEHLNDKTLLILASNYWQYLNGHFSIQKVYKKHLVQTMYDGRLFETIVDLIIVTNREIVIIQNSSYDKGTRKWRSKTKSLAPWFYFVKKAVRDTIAINKQPIRTLTHFVMGGGLVEIEIVNKHRQTSLFGQS